MPELKDLHKASEHWTSHTPPPSNRRFYISVHYGKTATEIHFQVTLDDLDDGPQLGESEIRAIAATLDEVHKRLMIPKGETKC